MIHSLQTASEIIMGDEERIGLLIDLGFRDISSFPTAVRIRDAFREFPVHGTALYVRIHKVNPSLDSLTIAYIPSHGGVFASSEDEDLCYYGFTDITSIVIGQRNADLL